jgi:hypothetical protein
VIDRISGPVELIGSEKRYTTGVGEADGVVLMPACGQLANTQVPIRFMGLFDGSSPDRAGYYVESACLPGFKPRERAERTATSATDDRAAPRAASSSATRLHRIADTSVERMRTSIARTSIPMQGCQLAVLPHISECGALRSPIVPRPVASPVSPAFAVFGITAASALLGRLAGGRCDPAGRLAAS